MFMKLICVTWFNCIKTTDLSWLHVIYLYRTNAIVLTILPVIKRANIHFSSIAINLVYVHMLLVLHRRHALQAAWRIKPKAQLLSDTGEHYRVRLIWWWSVYWFGGNIWFGGDICGAGPILSYVKAPFNTVRLRIRAPLYWTPSNL